ncbi:MAG TPA: dTDP-4-amino-4,6-dideoxygalactose transaminase [Pseudogracilibacillus sp.]|nr:dTDP-4-amino-4,6-dideoxygalactose transaminase [Pseudogracilibacillus sp.]
MIPFNKPSVIGTEQNAIEEAIKNGKLAGNGPFGNQCSNWLEKQTGSERALLTPSCTAALEMAALLTDAQAGDEVIMPSYTFVSTANAFALRGAHIRFVDIDPATMNISPEKIKEAITANTAAIVVVHYAGVSCDMNAIMDIANAHQLWVVEDAAQALMCTYKNKPLGTIGHFGTISFHETKNYVCGEGGALLINDAEHVERAEILQEKGTNRKLFAKGMVDKYTWRDIGSSYLLSELNAAYLSVQLEHAKEITNRRMEIWTTYHKELQPLEDAGLVSLPTVPGDCVHNAHLFYIKTSERTQLMEYLKNNGVTAVSHYEPLHNSHAGLLYGRFSGEDTSTTEESEKLLRLPLYYNMEEEDVDEVIKTIFSYYQS